MTVSIKQRTLLISFQLVLFLAVPHAMDMEDVKIQGFLSQGYLKSTANNFYAETEKGSFEFNEMGINFTNEPIDNLHMGMQFFARDLGRLDNDELTINWAYGDYRMKDYLGIRGGMIPLIHGLYNDIRDMDALRVNIFYPNGQYNESWRNLISSLIGGGVYGNLPVFRLGKLRYAFQAGVINVPADCGAMDLLEDQLPVYAPGFTSQVTDTSVDPVYNFSLFIDSLLSLDGLKTGMTAIHFSMTADMNLFYKGRQFVSSESLVDLDITVFSVEYSHKKWCLAGELARNTYNLSLSGIKVPEYTSLAWYASLSYSLSERWEIYTAYAKSYASEDDKDGSKLKDTMQPFKGWMNELILAVRLDINDNWMVKFETHINNGVNSLLDMDQDSPEQLPDGRLIYPYKENWTLFAFKLSYVF